jgi:hypothetical protein
MLGKGLPNAGIIYQDMIVMLARREENGDLRLRGIRGGRDYLDVLYEDAAYGQLDESSAGLRIALVEELTCGEISEPRHNAGVNRMRREVPERFAELLDAVYGGKCRIYAHYTIKERKWDASPETEERFVLARRVNVRAVELEERLAWREAENTERKSNGRAGLRLSFEEE